MENNKDISYIVFEGEMARAERHIQSVTEISCGAG